MPDNSAHEGVQERNILISTSRIDGVKVATRDGEDLGSVQQVMLNKRTGEASYAVLRVGGFLGMGKSYYPLPFQFLSYDAESDGYVVTIDRRLLEGGPSWSNNAPDFDQAYADRVSSYYEAPRIDISI